MKLDFEYLKKEILATNVKSEYKQSSIIILRNIFKEAKTKQLSIHDVVHSGFYCMDAENSNGSCHCSEQCNSCVDY